MEDTHIVRTENTNTDIQDRRHRHRQTVRIEDTYSQDGRHRQLGWKTQSVRMEDTDSRNGRHR